ncbi:MULTISPECIES: HlyD family type I secretion periplasmic adaptor subunit [unclassified Aureimonas]|uniref:HlyD family type I secretion periplasmic adaptor subunit n=1 Tax=unclassified Aureimonas TaxID=2615206 RepID=UPI0006FE3016|nr:MULTISPECIES: HlyD family type I secretion periplasmic adaptor subunit [unclassified Aureimonas]KQT64061.1 hypothetical protein ASG62_03330 [Aureimonas sp. Leaf427]KQT81253.1 hypothetical protein ASG54_00600 [Aureimonas sp. Leaf460]
MAAASTPAVHVTEAWYDSVPRSIRAPTIAGIAVIVVALGGFGAWASTAPLAAAVIASGSFVAVGQNKLVQHFEGGIVRQITAREGDRVVKGQTIMLLDDTAPKADFRRLNLRLARLSAASSRLQAMIAGADAIDFAGFPDVEGAEAELAEIRTAETSVFRALREQVQSSVAIIETSIEALRERSGGSLAQLNATREQTVLIGQELTGKKTLADKGLISRTQLFEVQRAAAQAQGSIGRLSAEIGDLRSQVARYEGQIAQIRQEARQKAGEELQRVSAEIDDIREQIQKSGNILERINIRAPVSGILVKLHYHTAGGVVESGKQIAEILPQGEKLVIEAPLRPMDIDDVVVGQHSTVRLTSLNQRTTPVLSGIVTYVSADTLRDEKLGTNAPDVYLVRVALDDTQVSDLQHAPITPGMPAEIFIETASRTFLDYITKPIRDSMQRAFREL